MNSAKINKMDQNQFADPSKFVVQSTEKNCKKAYEAIQICTLMHCLPTGFQKERERNMERVLLWYSVDNTISRLPRGLEGSAVFGQHEMQFRCHLSSTLGCLLSFVVDAPFTGYWNVGRNLRLSLLVFSTESWQVLLRQLLLTPISSARSMTALGVTPLSLTCKFPCLSCQHRAV